MLKRRVPRVLLSGFLLVLAVSGLSACRTSPSVAAYVGNTQVTVAELQSAVDQRLQDKGIAAYAKGKEGEFTRRVLGLLIQEDVYAAAVQRYSVDATNAEVRAHITELLGSDDPNTVYAQLAQQGISREDVFENVRQQLIRQRIAASEGKASVATEAELRARYAQVRPTLGKVALGYITVPTQAAANAVLAQLTKTPAAYPTLAAKYPSPTTLATLEPRAPADVPAPLAQAVTAAKPNTGFTLPVPEVGGVIVGFVGGTVYPTFEEERPTLEKASSDAADAAGNQLIGTVRSTLHIRVNPRYGVLKNGQLVADSTGTVRLLADTSASTSGGSGN